MPTFPFHRGTSLSMWLAQADVHDERHLATKCTCADFLRLARAGADHIRLPVDHELIEEPLPPHGLRVAGLRWVEQALTWAMEAGLGVTLDLHKCAGMSFFTPEQNRIWASPDLQQRFAALWRNLALHFRHIPEDRLVFELLNEPTSVDHELWNVLAEKALAEIRNIDSHRWVVIGSNSWNVPSTFPHLRDFRDPKVAYAVHWYEPFIFTHQKANWCTWLKALDLTVHYPGRVDDLSSQAVRLGDHPAWIEQMMLFSGEALGYERMERCFRPVAEFAARTGAPIYCTEFGCWDPAPVLSQWNWFRDCLRLFDRHQVAWAQWDNGHLFKGGQPTAPVAILFPPATSIP